MKIDVGSTPKSANKKLETAVSKKEGKPSTLKNGSESKEASKVSTPKPAEKAKPTKVATPVAAEEPAYVVAFSAREPTEEEKAQSKSYSPSEVRSKAKAFLESGNLPPEQRQVLAEIIKKQEAEEHAAIKKRVKGS